jgi:hypothetical protein
MEPAEPERRLQRGSLATSLARLGVSMKRKTVYLNGTPLGVAQTWDQVSALLGRMPVRDVQDHANEGPGGFYITLESEGVGAGNLSSTHPTTPWGSDATRDLRRRSMS